MTPREKRRIALISVVVISLAVLCLALYFIPTFLYVLFILGGSCIACFYHNNDSPSHSREGHHPRSNLIIPPLFRRWLPVKTANGVPSAGRPNIRGNRGRFIKGDPRESIGLSAERRLESPGVYRKEAEELSGSLLFSPRDILMGSYLGKPDSSSAVGRLGGGETRELRERLSRPNHAVHTPNRRLSFGEPLGTPGRFTITPQRHYPIQQAGCSSLGVLAPAQWHGYRKKNILTPRNSPGVHSPVTVKIARPDHGLGRSSLFNHTSSPLPTLSPSLGLGATADPCARETVLSVLKESRKREVDEDEDRSYADEQKSKRRRHDSSESAQSAFEPLLANGAPSQLVPKPGRMKRGINTLVVEETMVKRSRTSSVSSMGSGLTPIGGAGSARNPIHSSYSSTKGNAQKKTSTLSLSPLSSPGSSRSQTPERPPKKPREEAAQSPSAVSTLKSDVKVAGQVVTTGTLTPTPKAPVATSTSSSGGSEGKRKRKIQLVPSRRGDHISLPPPPELGYTITVRDLDLEKKAALDRIKKALEEPEPVKPAPVPTATATPFSQAAVSSEAPSTSGGLLSGSIASVAPVSTAASSTAPSAVPGSEPAPAGSTSTLPTSLSAASAPAAPALGLSNPLLESLKRMKDSPAPSPANTPAAPPAAAADVVPVEPAAPSPMAGFGAVKSEPSLTPAQLSLTPAQPTVAPAQPSVAPALASVTSAQSTSAVAPSIQLPSSVSSSAFSQVLPQPAQTSAPAQPVTFNLASMVKPSVPSSSSSSASSISTSAATSTATETASSNPPTSVFKPIFGAGMAAPASSSTSTPAAPTFKPIFGSATAGSAFGQPSAAAPAAPAAPASESSSVFSRLSSTTVAPEPAAPTPAKSLFGSWSAAPPASTGTISATTNGSSFQFGATPAATSAPTLNSTTTAPAPAPAPFQFGAMATTTAAPQTAPLAAPVATTQASFAFGQPASSQTTTSGVFGGFGMTATTSTATAPAPASQPAFTFGKPSFDGPTAFPSAPQAVAPKPFSFGGSGGSGTTPFSFGGATTTAAPTFGTPSQPAFGGGSSGFAFGGTTAPSATPTFGSSTQASAPLPAPTPSFSFGGASAAQPSAPAPTQSNPLQPATGGFNFGAAVAGTQFGTPTPANPPGLTQSFSFGASNAKDSKPAFGFNFGSASVNFGTSTPAFGQSSGGPIPFGSPSFSGIAPTPFGASPTPSFSIGSGSKPSGARQRLQARRQHPRKK
ncbi:nuclear envelope pore membrane protein POM 121 isoform X1 [Megalops cyprinoides]|uniref:nuclear envelope pore membrane protein POM 121 isoform X1 n=1 Tax=Megalops cyprinoides TaxID=118141 RepID=UPI0018649651|nr:nuclear envelope pore membrane protein POM 121 isoform X1 [Megalops cyprinoides]